MSKRKIIISIFILMCFTSYNALAQQNGTNSCYKKIKNFDLSIVFNPDSITDDGFEKYKRPEILGYIGTNFQRFQIHFTSFIKSQTNPYEYRVSGKTKVKDNINSFTGTVTIFDANFDNSSLMKDLGFPKFKAGYLTSKVLLYEDKSQPNSGYIKGDLSTDIYFDDKGQIHYHSLLLVSDSYSNNQFTGKWTSYKTGKSKKCNWGDFRIPESNGLDGGTGEFMPMEKYLDYGWRNYYNLKIGFNDDAKRIAAERIEYDEWWK
jgi:hypothetical protein